MSGIESTSWGRADKFPFILGTTTIEYTKGQGMNIYHRLDSAPFNQVQNSEQYSYPYGKQEVFLLFRGTSGG